MFVFIVKYIKPIKEIDKLLNDHIAFLDRYYDEGKLVISGRQNPRLGGVIICNADSREEAERIVSEDPFYKEEAAEYHIIEFTANKCATGLEMLLD